MLLQLIRGEDEFLLGPLIRRVIVIGVEGIDGQ